MRSEGATRRRHHDKAKSPNAEMGEERLDYKQLTKEELLALRRSVPTKYNHDRRKNCEEATRTILSSCDMPEDVKVVMLAYLMGLPISTINEHRERQRFLSTPLWLPTRKYYIETSRE